MYFLTTRKWTTQFVFLPVPLIKLTEGTYILALGEQCLYFITDNSSKQTKACPSHVDKTISLEFPCSLIVVAPYTTVSMITKARKKGQHSHRAVHLTNATEPTDDLFKSLDIWLEPHSSRSTWWHGEAFTCQLVLTVNQCIPY
jgi:hypothetical protein